MILNPLLITTKKCPQLKPSLLPIDRESLVIATKYSGPTPGATGPNAAGNNKKNMFRALDESLKRLQTNYVDVFYVHFWDFTLDVTQLIRW